MSVFAPALNYFWKSATDLGLDAEQLFRDAGIEPEIRKDATARVPAEKIDDFLWHARQQSQDDAFSFSLARNLHPSFMGALGYAWLTSATLRKAFTRLQRYAQMLNDQTHLALEEQGEEFHVVLTSAEGNTRDPHLRERHRLATTIQFCRMNLGESFSPSRVHLQQGVPANLVECEAFFRCPLSFESSDTRIVLPAALADQDLPGYDPQLVQHFDQLIIDYLDRQKKLDTVGRVRAAIYDQLPTGEICLENVAAELIVSPRTLTRKLAEKGLSFKSLLADTRRELAEKYIADRSLTITEISFLLGFSETSSFSRAFKGWTGQSPRLHREGADTGR